MNSNVSVNTSGQPQQILFGFELSKDDQLRFQEKDRLSAQPFVRIDGVVYDLDDFTKISPEQVEQHPELAEWTSWALTGSNQGVLIKYQETRLDELDYPADLVYMNSNEYFDCFEHVYLASFTIHSVN